MNTPVQEHIEWMQEKLRILVEYKELSAGAEVDECIQHAEAMLEKEKLYMSEAYYNAFINATKGIEQDFEDYQKETFNTK